MFIYSCVTSLVAYIFRENSTFVLSSVLYLSSQTFFSPIISFFPNITYAIFIGSGFKNVFFKNVFQCIQKYEVSIFTHFVGISYSVLQGFFFLLPFLHFYIIKLLEGNDVLLRGRSWSKIPCLACYCWTSLSFCFREVIKSLLDSWVAPLFGFWE